MTYNDSSRTNGAYKSLEVEIVNFCMLTFEESLGDHRSLCFDIFTLSFLGKLRYKNAAQSAGGWSHHNSHPSRDTKQLFANNLRSTKLWRDWTPWTWTR
jgi:hypothetical protein